MTERHVLDRIRDAAGPSETKKERAERSTSAVLLPVDTGLLVSLNPFQRKVVLRLLARVSEASYRRASTMRPNWRRMKAPTSTLPSTPSASATRRGCTRPSAVPAATQSARSTGSGLRIRKSSRCSRKEAMARPRTELPLAALTPEEQPTTVALARALVAGYVLAGFNSRSVATIIGRPPPQAVAAAMDRLHTLGWLRRHASNGLASTSRRVTEINPLVRRHPFLLINHP